MEPDDSTDAERQLEELDDRIEQTKADAEDALEPGGDERTFADLGVRTQVERDGDTHHPPADA